MIQQTPRSPAVRVGTTYGGFVAAIVLIVTALGLISPAIGTITGCLGALAYITLFFVGGMVTARQTGRAGSGAFAGLIAGAIGGLVGMITGIVLLLALPNEVNTLLRQLNSSSTSSGVTFTRSDVITVGVVLQVVSFVFAIAIGAAIGALGGLAGKGQYRPPMPPYQEAMYQGMQPMGAYPPLPQQGNWPQTPEGPGDGNDPYVPPPPPPHE